MIRWQPETQQRLAANDAEIAQNEQSLERCYEAFEQGTFSLERCQARLTRLQTRLADLHAQQRPTHALDATRATHPPTAADLANVADHLERLLTTSQPQKANALIRELVAELNVNRESRDPAKLTPSTLPRFAQRPKE